MVVGLIRPEVFSNRGVDSGVRGRGTRVINHWPAALCVGTGWVRTLWPIVGVSNI